MPTSAEPSLASLPNPILRYIAATRPAFLSVTFAGCLLGLAGAAFDGVHMNGVIAAATVFFALIAHAGVNVLNDYFDAASGTDAINTGRIFPFTGGSRFIQNGVLTRRATGIFGYALLLSIVPPGLWLALQSGAGLLLIGLLGMLVGWAYSAPPLQLASRGLGECAVAAGWLLIVAGSDYVQRGAASPTPLAAGIGYALLNASLLYVNQFPDAAADAKTGKRTMVVRLGLARARWGYLLLAGAAYGWVAACIALRWLPSLASLSLLPGLLSLFAARTIWLHGERPERLAPAIKCTILSVMAHSATLALALVLSRQPA